ncbi:hypothetical protein [Streptomyces poriferorum]|uniref:Uncharacterized protein n=1 Tax=Streptomyces poriferorum TaxID=2798799 RepID=A0ABY9IY78_9ACTN|nr:MULTISPECIES: hypothetical protein [unclassified Streptomyces]MDP5310391.1 hypothetical protein [Streptomyces sp. Alt4]WLQ60455.1 hypothetical protein P8A19_35750 [Streptomyces sp. Alt2]
MARLQILELPEGGSDDRPPFVLIVDQYEPVEATPSRLFRHQDMAEQIGARAVLVFDDTIDIPANDTSAFAQSHAAALYLDDREVRTSIAADMNKAREQAGVAIIGQSLADERTDIARDMDRLAKRRDELAEALGMDRTRDWDDIVNTAAGIRRSRDSMRDAIQRVRDLPEQPDIMDAQHREPTGYLHGYRIAIREAKRATQEPEPSRSTNG